MSNIKNGLRNEYVKSLVLLVIILGGIVAFWVGFRAYLRTEYPLLAVASGSMVPTLNVGDLIIVQGGLNVSDVSAEYGTGDIVIFHKPDRPEELIVHRAVEKHQNDDVFYLRTQGDNNQIVDGWKIYDEHLVGKVVGVIPYLGHVPLFVHTPTGMTIIVILIVILVLLEFVIPIIKEKAVPEESKDEIDFSDLGSL
ncbi:MAG: signal peptidase I [Candidatus Bathyarchaeia archaeon]